MNCQSLFSGKNKKNYLRCLLKCFCSMLSIKVRYLTQARLSTKLVVFTVKCWKKVMSLKFECTNTERTLLFNIYLDLVTI